VKSITKNEQNGWTFGADLTIGRLLDHEFIVRLHAAFTSHNAFHLVMDLCEGGDLETLISSNWPLTTPFKVAPKKFSCFSSGKASPFSRARVAELCHMMISAVAYLHHHRFIHRDVKASNFVLVESKPHSAIKLIDFDTAIVDNGQLPNDCCGTKQCLAPEILVGEKSGTVVYDEKCDIWGIGIIAHRLCAGFYFPCTSDPEINYQSLGNYQSESSSHTVISRGDEEDRAWERQHPRAQELVLDMLSHDPGLRPSAKQLLNDHAWLHDCKH
jgi:serine/threonine protein kinase